MLNCRVVAAFTALVVATPISAQTQTQPTPKEAAPNQNAGALNERICANITLTGSRLATKRFCGTRAQWADKQLQDRQEVERIQRSPCVYQHNSVTGRPSC